MPNSASRALILAPQGRDAVVASTLLHEAGITATICADLRELERALADDAGLVVITEEAVGSADLRGVASWLQAQPAWSDLPFIILTAHGGEPERNPGAARLSELLGNVTFLERPFHSTTFVSLARTALKGRQRQYETRARIEALHESEEQLRTALLVGRLGSWQLDLATSALAASAPCKALFGRAADAPTVEDTGHGMDGETLRKATEPFFSTKGLGKGTGLGLSMIHGLAVQLGGALRLTSAVGRGTRAELWLPATIGAVTVRKAEPLEPTGEPARRITILVVDDDVLIAMSTADMLEDLGHEVIEAHSAEGALDILKNGRRVDLLMTDYSMPRMNGAQLAKAAREVLPELPILLATGYAELPPGSAVDLPRIGKPYRQNELAAEIDKVLRSSRSGTATVGLRRT